MLSHPIVRTAMGLLAAGALAGGLAPVVLAHGAPAPARGEHARAVLVVDRVEDRFEQAAMQEASVAHPDVDKAKAEVDKAKADADDQKADADEQGADADGQAVGDDPDDDRASGMAEAQAIQARIESAEQAAMAREEAREARIRALVSQFTQMAR